MLICTNIGYLSMVIGLAGMAAAGIAALPTGLGFGYGYGYGVRMGYHAFKVPKKQETGLHLSPDPIQGAMGAGLHSADEHVQTPGKEGLTTELPSTPGLISASSVPETQSTSTNEQERHTNDAGWSLTKEMIFSKGKKHNLTPRESWRAFVKSKYPFNKARSGVSPQKGPHSR